jgi:peptidoglycan/xylan/chitin deacetylase (PgdA/CDA1 family)
LSLLDEAARAGFSSGLAPSYLLRFDDICPTMAWSTWDKVEAALDEAQVRPIVAIVPDNQDPKLIVEPARADFWERARGWQARGWSIGLHGHQHRYSTEDPGLVGLNPYSELAGLSEAEQKEKLALGLAVFAAQGIKADLFVAPAHSFDEATLAALGALGVGVLSDGLFPLPRRSHGLLWVPQQVWRFRPMPPGVWTICIHANRWGDPEVDRLRRDLERYRRMIVDLPSVIDRYGERKATGLAPYLAKGALQLLKAKKR